MGTVHRSPLPSKARSRPDRAQFCRRRRPLGSGLGPRHSRTDAKPHRRRKSECVHSEHPNTWRVSLPCGVRSSCKTDATEAGARALVTPGAESRPLGTHGWRGDANSTGKTARPGAGPSRGAVQNTHVLGYVFWQLTLGGRGLGGEGSGQPAPAVSRAPSRRGVSGRRAVSLGLFSAVLRGIRGNSGCVTLVFAAPASPSQRIP